MSCPARINSALVAVYCTRIDGHPGAHVASIGNDYLSLGIALEVWDDDHRYLPHDPEHTAAVKAHRAEQPHLEVTR